VLPSAREAKIELLEKARVLESSLWADYNRADEPTARAALGSAILRCHARMASLLGADTPSQLAVMLATNPPSDADDIAVAHLKTLPTDDLRTMMALWQKAATTSRWKPRRRQRPYLFRPTCPK